MRHRKSIAKLGRTASHRKALLANLASSLFEKKHIRTTEAKAKAARRFAEKLITAAKKDSVHARRIVLKRLRSKKAVQILFNDVAPMYKERNGGYTRVIKLGQRHGDGASMAVLELVGFEKAEKKKEKAESDKTESKKKDKSKKKAEKPEKEVKAAAKKAEDKEDKSEAPSKDKAEESEK